MRLIIAGSRGFNNYELLKSTCDFIFKNMALYDVQIVSGGARGADLLGEKYAAFNGIHVKRFIPNWSIGKRAGFLRNEEMAKYGTHLLAFWDGKSRGTFNMINLAKQYKLNWRVIHF